VDISYSTNEKFRLPFAELWELSFVVTYHSHATRKRRVELGILSTRDYPNQIETTGLTRAEIGQVKVSEAVTSQKLESETKARKLRWMPRATGLSGTMVVVLKSRLCKNRQAPKLHGISHLSAPPSNGSL
jgi:hypothetical protein